MAENVIFEFKTPEGDILEWEGPESTAPEMVKRKFMQTILKNPQLSPTIAKSQGYNPGKAPDDRSAGQVALDQTGNVVKGAASLVTGLPGMLAEVGGATWDVVGGGNKKRGLERGMNLASGMVEGITAPIKPVMQTVAPGTFGEATNEDWEHGAQAAGGNLAGLLAPGAAGAAGKVVGRAVAPEALMSLAAKAKAYRTANPILDTISNVDITKPVGMVRGAVQAAKSTGAAIAAPVLEKVARVRAGEPLIAGRNYTPVDDAVAGAPDPIASVLDTERAAITEPLQSPIRNTPDEYRPQFTEPEPLASEPVGIERPISRDAMGQPVDDFLDPLRQMETPEQMYERQVAQRNMEFQPEFQRQPDPFTEQQPVGAQRPAPQEVVDQFGQPIETTPRTGLDAQIPDVPPEVAMAREALLEDGVPRSAKNMEKARINAEYLLEAVPELRNVPPGVQFNVRLYNALDRTGKLLKETENAIPRDKSVSTFDQALKIEEIADNAAMFGDKVAVRAANKLRDFLAEGSVKWEDFIKEKRAFFDEVKTTSQTGKAVYQVLKDISNSVSKELGVLNQKWYTLKTSSELAALSPYSGEKLVTKARTLAQRAKERRQ